MKQTEEIGRQLWSTLLLTGIPIRVKQRALLIAPYSKADLERTLYQEPGELAVHSGLLLTVSGEIS